MKRYSICFLFIFIFIFLILVSLWASAPGLRSPLDRLAFPVEGVTPNEPEYNHQTTVGPGEKTTYCIIYEEDSLVIRESDTKIILERLPVSDFYIPESMRASLISGIEFSEMIDIFSFLESLSS